MQEQSIVFNASIPDNYERYLVPFLFDGFAKDMVKRVVLPESKSAEILELAAGTGVLTRHLAGTLPANARLTASDIEEDMLAIARKNSNSPIIDWSITDMTAIDYDDEKFSNVVCQFGLMLISDVENALREIYRVLNKGGQFLFNIWSDIGKNPVWDITGSIVASFTGINPVMQRPGPFALDKAETIQLLTNAGFRNISAENVNIKGVIGSASDAAKGFTEGLPLAATIRKKAPSMLLEILDSLEKELMEKLGTKPLISPLQATVFTSNK